MLILYRNLKKSREITAVLEITVILEIRAKTKDKNGY
jgi:hypothetical protein